MTIKLRLVLPYLFLILLTALILNLANPLFDKPARDGGFFLYAGSQILDGKTPYLDFWDSKGPAIFYINALGLWLGGGSRWGIWFVEFLCIFGALALLYHSLSNRWGIGAALFGATLGGLSLRAALGYGNYTEEYALLFNAAGLAIFFSMMGQHPEGSRESDWGLVQTFGAVRNIHNYWKYIWVGALFSLSFTFRANNIGGFFTIALGILAFYGFHRNFREAMRILVSLGVGFALPLILWTLYFALLGAASEMIYASLIFNFSYSAAAEREWLDFFGGFGRYGMGWYSWFTLAAWFVLVLRALASFVQRKLSVFETFLLFWFPIEILLSNLSGRNFTHYYISWMPAVAVYSALVFAEFWQAAFKVPPLEGWSENAGAVVSAILIAALFFVSPSAWERYGKAIRADQKEFIDPLSAYVRANTQPDDLVLTWYPEMRINFTAGRASPVKYLYYPLFLEGSLSDEIERSYLMDLKTRRPVLILDCSREVDAIPSLDPAARKEQFSTPGLKRKMYIPPRMDEVFEFVEQNYRIENTIEGCIIFRAK